MPAINRYCPDDRNLPESPSLNPHRQKKLEQNVYQYELFLDNSLEPLDFCTDVDLSESLLLF
jgi:hypothetical protein